VVFFRSMHGEGAVDIFPMAGGGSLRIAPGDLTRAEVDAVVNAANERMLGGGGVDGALHRAAGPRLLEACRAVAEVRPGVRCPTGEARITPGFELPAPWVIHTVGPVYENAERSAPLLRAAYRSSLDLALDRGLASIAFPAISCGVFAYPLDEAAPLAIETCRQHGAGLREIHFVLFDDAPLEAWRRASREMLQ
jgi:O-acetyl-ADP-ribose deacetylase (regulator of RNase III)